MNISSYSEKAERVSLTRSISYSEAHFAHLRLCLMIINLDSSQINLLSQSKDLADENLMYYGNILDLGDYFVDM